MRKEHNESQLLRDTVSPEVGTADATVRRGARTPSRTAFVRVICSVSAALSRHGSETTDPLRRRPSLNLTRPRSGSSRHSHAQRSAVAPAPRDAAPRAHRRHSRTAFGGAAWPRPPRLRGRSLFACVTCHVSAPSQPDTAPRAVRQRRRRHGEAHCAPCAASAVSSAGAQAVATCDGTGCRNTWHPVRVRSHSSRTKPVRELPPCPVLFLLNLASPVPASFCPVTAVTASPPT